MKKKKKKIFSKNTISNKIIHAISREQEKKIIDLKDIKNGKINAEYLQKSIITKDEMAGLDPLYAIYIFAQNNMSILVDQISQFQATAKLISAYSLAHEEYMPSWPPESPLSTSYFTCWGYFDLGVGINKESFGEVVINVSKYLKVDESIIQLYQILQGSRNGIYIHCGVEGDFVILEEFITKKTIKAIVPSGYKGQMGEIWLTRVLDEPKSNFSFNYSVVFTSPYVIGRSENEHWCNIGDQLSVFSFLKRNINEINIPNKIEAYKHFMKYGLNRNYWNEYIFLGYVNHSESAIFLTGIPDMPYTLPHSPFYGSNL